VLLAGCSDAGGGEAFGPSLGGIASRPPLDVWTVGDAGVLWDVAAGLDAAVDTSDLAAPADDDVGLDVPPQLPDAPGGDADTASETAIVDGPIAKPESCGNLLDDDLDGLVDEGCVAPPDVPAGDVWSDLGWVQVPAGGGAGRPLQVPEWAGSFLVLLRQKDSDPLRHVWVRKLVAPSGAVLVDPATPLASKNRGSSGFGIGTLLVQNFDGAAFEPGTWTIEPGRALDPPMVPGPPVPTSPGWVHLGVLLRPQVGSAKLTIPLDIYPVAGVPLPCATLLTSPAWLAVRAQANATLEQASLGVGDVRCFDIGGSDGDTFKYIDSVAGSDSELRQLMLRSKLGAPSTAVPVFFVLGISAEDGSEPAGVSGTIAGPAGLMGTHASGIVINTQDWVDLATSGAVAKIAETYGMVIPHELCHWLGVNHTSERDASLHDLISDTPQCTNAGTDGILEPSECSEGAQNLMFWMPLGTSLSAGQKAVVRRHPNGQ